MTAQADGRGSEPYEAGGRAVTAMRPGTAAVAASTLMVLLAACSGSGDDSGGDTGTAGPSASAAADDPGGEESAQDSGEPGTSSGTAAGSGSQTKSSWTEADLEAVVLKQGDLAEFQVTEVPAGARDVPATRADPAACQPLENMRLDAFDPAPSATARRFVLATRGDHLGTGTTLTLAAYSEADAQKIMTGLRKAVKDCAGGYSGGALPFSKVNALDAVDTGDEAVSYHMLGRGETTRWYTLVRPGAVLLRFSSDKSTEDNAEVPTPVVVQQTMKLQAAEASR